MGSEDTEMARKSALLGEAGVHLGALRRFLFGVGIALLAVLLVAATRLKPIHLLHPPTAPPGRCATATQPAYLILATWVVVALASVPVGVRALSGDLGALQRGRVTPREWTARALTAGIAALLVMAAAFPLRVGARSVTLYTLGPEPKIQERNLLPKQES